MAKIVNLPAGVPVNLYSAATLAVGSELRVVSLSDFPIKLFVTTAAPLSTDGYALLEPGDALVNNQGALGAWATSAAEAQVMVERTRTPGWRGAEGAIPSAALRGEAALNVQFYDESNRKLGSQWGASRRIVNAALNQKFHSILKTRTLPLDLKARIFSYTGAGVIARFYTGFTPQVLPTAEPMYSLRPGAAAFRDFDLYVLPAPLPIGQVGTPWSYDLFLEGAAQVQGKGAVNAPAGIGWVVEPQREILLEIESLDAQNISATLVAFNGLLDLPIS